MQWYILHTRSGFEKKVAQTIIEQAEKKGISEYIGDVIVPTEEVMEMRKGQKVAVEKKFFPGYVLIYMNMNDDLWHFIRSIPKVSGFIGPGGKPQAVPESQVSHIRKQMEEGSILAKQDIMFHVGEAVRVDDGPFESFIGTVEDVDETKSRLKVSVSIFGRSTPVELEFSQVSKTA